MRLSEILHDVDYTVVNGNIDIKINKLDYDSRNINNGDLFFCIEGFNTDGHNYIGKAFDNGAVAIVISKDIDNLPDCTIIKVKDSRKALALASQNYYDHPAKKLKLIGVTGTNGKTTTTFMIKAILEDAGYKVGLVGTISNYIGDVKIPSHRTTPESLELNALFKDMVDSEVEYCVMEVSSHSLALDRVYGLLFSEAIFTNLTQDHLDFHKTFENYFNSKLILFKNSLNTIINIDDSYGKRVYNEVDKNKITCSINETADVMAYDIEMHSKGVNFNLKLFEKYVKIALNIPGRYNIYNALGCAAACANEGISIEYIKSGLERVFVPGRCEIVTKGSNLDFDVILDYAHTPDGLENILKTAREFTKGRLISIFGCGGDRDNTKRPIMGNIGTELSDFAIITSDNPRSEEPMKIIEDILKGVNRNNYTVVENRRDAIKKAIEIARKDDIIVLAGKGHEDYQILKDKTIHFDEKEIVSELIKEINKGI